MAKRPTNTTIKLGKALVLNRWVLHQFGVDALESLVDGDLKRSIYEGFDAENKSNIHNYLLHRLPSFNTVTKDDLIRWDQHIVRHTLAISESRNEVLKWKYFQYITLLFTELYLERYFKDPDALLQDLNEYVDQWNDPMNEQVRNTSGHVCDPFTPQEINKIAYWNATGSGKTLLMHVNILQYKHYVERFGIKKGLNKVLLVTPNEGLSQQHLEEFKQNGIQAELFSKSAGSAFSGETVEVVEISKLAEESGEKTVAVEAFETNNLVLIDEGHRGVAGDQWKTRRDELSANGFAFEYSATFGQAVSAANGKKRTELTQEYAKSILMDYSYKYFHEDGYGKDYRILNLPSDERAEQKRKYMTGSLLAFYQQKMAYRDHPRWAAVYRVSDPLWVFVGGSVNAVRKVGGITTSDVLEVVRFCKQFIAEPKKSKQHLEELLSGNDGLLDQAGKSVFTGFYYYLQKQNINVETLYADILESVFNNTLAGADVYVDRLKGQDGELGLRVGNADYFGVVNVGDEKKLWDLCQANGIDGQDKDFTGSLFHDINQKGSRINLLIGSKKFTEGWSSWRVSTMGLLNIGKSEGSQVIQLFGRGVRLKGYELSLKRSQRLDQDQRPESKLPKDLPILETLNVFGIQADYMQHFKQFLQEEGLAPKDGRFISVEVPTMINIDLKSSKLKVLQLRENVDFRKDQMIPLVYDAGIGKGSVRLEWYAKLQQLVSAGGVADVEVHYNTPLNEQHLAFVDWDEVYFALQRHKNERIWNNLGIQRQGMKGDRASP
ncbi:MAG: DEAD/DEAH box helicase family protein [Flavobacteriales bacterium]|nr:DEAD/DEAH box helicase family protein [Flavobacteriales bacterium]